MRTVRGTYNHSRTCGHCGHDHHHGYEHHDGDLGFIRGIIFGALLYLLVQMNMGGDDGGGGGGAAGALPARNGNLFRAAADLFLFRGKRSLNEPWVIDTQGGFQATYVSSTYGCRLKSNSWGGK